MRAAEAVLLEVSDDAGNILSFCSLAEFVEANADDAEVCEQARALALDQSFRAGGGAAPIFDIRRASGAPSRRGHQVPTHISRGVPVRPYTVPSSHGGYSTPLCIIYMQGPPTLLYCATHSGTFEPEDYRVPVRCPKASE